MERSNVERLHNDGECCVMKKNLVIVFID